MEIAMIRKEEEMGVIKVADTGSFMMMSFQHLMLESRFSYWISDWLVMEEIYYLIAYRKIISKDK